MAVSDVLSALNRTIEQATFEFEYQTTDRQPDGVSASTKGYCDLAGPIVAAEMVVDVRFKGFENAVRSWTFTSGTTLYQASSAENDEWVALDSHGIGATALSTLFWLYGTRSAAPAERDGRYDVTLDFAEVFRTAGQPVAESLREGLHETRTDLLTASAHGHVDISPAGLVSYLELELPAYDGPDPALSQPAMLVTLALTPAGRRSIQFPETSARMSPETFKNLLIYGHDPHGPAR